MSKVINIDAPQFESEVLKSEVPVLVDFWAPWCRPCQMMGLVLDELAADVGSKAKVVKIDVDSEKNALLAREFQIMSIPSMKVFKGGYVVEEFVGMRSKSALAQSLEKAI